MSKKISRSLLLPIVSLLPLTQGMALTKNPPHPLENSPPATHASARDFVIQGKMLDHSTIQISAADVPTADQANAVRVITLMDAHGKKQRFILLPPDRTKWVQVLQADHGTIKEFNFYSVVDEQGHQIDRLASTRILEAPANQLTIVFPSQQDAKNFFTIARQQSLAEAGFVGTDLQAQINQARAISQTQEINDAIQEIQIQMHDTHKSASLEPVSLFPTFSILIVGTVIAIPPPSALHQGD